MLTGRAERPASLFAYLPVCPGPQPVPAGWASGVWTREAGDRETLHGLLLNGTTKSNAGKLSWDNCELFGGDLLTSEETGYMEKRLGDLCRKGRRVTHGQDMHVPAGTVPHAWPATSNRGWRSVRTFAARHPATAPGVGGRACPASCGHTHGCTHILSRVPLLLRGR